MKQSAVIFWSGGKDSALALRAIQQGGEYEIIALLTTLNEGEKRSGMHRVRRELLEAQAAAIGLPLHFIPLPAFPANSLYEDRVRAALHPFLLRGVRCAVFGDLFLTDIRAYRDRLLEPTGMTALYPLWQRNTAELAQEFFRAGFQARLVCIDIRAIDASSAGRLYNPAWLASLPAIVDPCGENGEFHTFVFDGPIFRHPLAITCGEATVQNGFAYCDLAPA